MNSYITDETPAGDAESITVSTTAIGPTSTKLNIYQAGGFNKHPVKILLTVAGNAINFRIDGTDPTSSVGHPMAAGDSITIVGSQNIARLKMIRSGGADGTAFITYFYNI